MSDLLGAVFIVTMGAAVFGFVDQTVQAIRRKWRRGA